MAQKMYLLAFNQSRFLKRRCCSEIFYIKTNTYFSSIMLEYLQLLFGPEDRQVLVQSFVFSQTEATLHSIYQNI